MVKDRVAEIVEKNGGTWHKCKEKDNVVMIEVQKKIGDSILHDISQEFNIGQMSLKDVGKHYLIKFELLNDK